MTCARVRACVRVACMPLFTQCLVRSALRAPSFSLSRFLSFIFSFHRYFLRSPINPRRSSQSPLSAPLQPNGAGHRISKGDLTRQTVPSERLRPDDDYGVSAAQLRAQNDKTLLRAPIYCLANHPSNYLPTYLPTNLPTSSSTYRNLFFCASRSLCTIPPCHPVGGHG